MIQKVKQCRNCSREFQKSWKYCTKKCEKTCLSAFKKLKKESSITFIKKQLWDVVSEYTRRKNADSNGFTECVTCGEVKHWKEMQAGHWIPRTYAKWYYEETNLHSQCYSCNVCKHSNPFEYREFMERTYWGVHVEMMERERKDICKRSRADYEEITAYYKDKLSKL